MSVREISKSTMDTVFRNDNDPNGVVLTMFSYHLRAWESKAPVTYCDHASSVVRPLDYLHFQPRLQNRLIDFN